jgi:hypothetical protein
MSRLHPPRHYAFENTPILEGRSAAMRIQHWGTYSVKDHDRDRAFVADVLLYDKLVIPRPATEKELRAGGWTGTVEDQVDRWRSKRWNPRRQRELLDILGEFDLAVELPWGGRTDEDYQRVYNKQYDEQMEAGQSALAQSIQSQIEMARYTMSADAAFLGTSGTIALYVADVLHNDVARKLFALAKTNEFPVEPVIAYRSFSKLKAKHGLQKTDNDLPAAPGDHALYGWELFVPEDSDLSDAQLLRKAARLASRKDFIEARQTFHGCLKQMHEGGIDPNDAKEKLMKLLGEYTAIMRKSRLKTVPRYAAKIVQIAAPLAGLAGHTTGVIAGVAASGAAWAVERLIPTVEVPERLQSAAMLYEARRFFGKK